MDINKFPRDAVTNQEGRRNWLGVLARAWPADIEEFAGAFIGSLDFEWLRRPQVGLVMVRGRAGGTGCLFNLGEMTLTRCSVRLRDGQIGHGFAQGRQNRQAQSAAIFDALFQQRPALVALVIEPLQAKETERRVERRRKAAATKVDFYTMVRGENPA